MRTISPRYRMNVLLPILFVFGSLAGCGNNPYPAGDADKKICYSSLIRSYPLDPVSAQSIPALQYLGCLYEPLFDYHYLKRPLELVPLLARKIPEFEPCTMPALKPGDPDRPMYRLRLEIWDRVLFHRDVCFDHSHHANRETRELTAEDFEFTFMRIADPVNNCPCYDGFIKIDGLEEWTSGIRKIREEDSNASELPIHELYGRAGKIRGVRVTGRYDFEMLLTAKSPILLYWLSCSISAPLPPEAVDYYDGRNGRPHLKDWPVGTGPYRMAVHRKDEFIAFDKNPDWRGITQPERRLPGTRYPTEGMPGDLEAGRLDPRYLDRPLPFIDRFEFRRDKETVTCYNKFVQGYYDRYVLEEEKEYRQALSGVELSSALAERGIGLTKETLLRTYYFAFNMEDDIVGAPDIFKNPEREKDHALWIERNRKLRQAMNLAFNMQEETDVFVNGLAMRAESPLPPGIFGYDPNYCNPYRQYDPDMTLARKLLAEAGYPDGIDPKTGRPLKIEMSVPGTDASTIEVVKMNARMFGRLGIDLTMDGVTYNAFVQKMRRGAFQLLRWAWSADYPDPQTFLLLLYGPERCIGTGRNNKANFKNARYDFLYEKMIAIGNDESATWTELGLDGRSRSVTMSRYEIVREMIRIFEYECPWIVNYHPISPTLRHCWYHNGKPSTLIYTDYKYLDIDAPLRHQKRKEWNPPVYAPAYFLVAVLVVVIMPGVWTYLRRTRR